MNFTSRFLSSLFLSLLLSFPVLGQTHWSRQNIPRQDTVFYGIAFADVDNGFAVGTDGAMFRTTNGGYTWVSKTLPTVLKLTAIAFPSKTTGFIVGETGTILKTTDAGETWFTLDAKTKMTFFAVHFFDEDSGFVAGQGATLLYTNDKGATWKSLDAKFGPNNIYSISFPTQRIGYICGNAGNISATTNGGRTWQSQDSKYNFALQGISFASATVGTAVGDGGTIRHTTNGGRNWVPEIANVPITSYPLYTVQHVDSANAFIGGWIGMILYKHASDLYWTALDVPYSDPLTAMYFFNHRLGYIAGWNTTILKTTNGGGTVTSASSVPQPAAATLFQNAPNPVQLSAAHATQFRFETRIPGRTTLRVYSPLGTEIATVFDEHLAPGRYIWNWTVPSIPSGSYYYILSTGTSSISRALTIVR